MATQHGTGSLTIGGQATAAAVFITVPSGCVVENVTTNLGGSPDFQDYQDADGAFHTRITYEAGMTTATITTFGVAVTGAAGTLDGSGSNYYILQNTKTQDKAPVRSVVNVELIPTI